MSVQDDIQALFESLPENKKQELKPFYLNKDPELLKTMDESHLSKGMGFVPSRGFTDDLMYGVGTSYLVGLGIGGLIGLQEGMQRNANRLGIRVTMLLNGVTSRGPFIANTVGMIVMYYNFMSFGLKNAGVNATASDYIGAGLAGSAYSILRGPRQMAIFGGLGVAGAGAWKGVRSLFRKG